MMTTLNCQMEDPQILATSESPNMDLGHYEMINNNAASESPINQTQDSGVYNDNLSQQSPIAISQNDILKQSPPQQKVPLKQEPHDDSVEKRFEQVVQKSKQLEQQRKQQIQEQLKKISMFQEQDRAEKLREEQLRQQRIAERREELKAKNRNLAKRRQELEAKCAQVKAADEKVIYKDAAKLIYKVDSYKDKKNRLQYVKGKNDIYYGLFRKTPQVLGQLHEGKQQQDEIEDNNSKPQTPEVDQKARQAESPVFEFKQKKPLRKEFNIIDNYGLQFPVTPYRHNDSKKAQQGSEGEKSPYQIVQDQVNKIRAQKQQETQSNQQASFNIIENYGLQYKVQKYEPQNNGPVYGGQEETKLQAYGTLLELGKKEFGE